MRHNPQQTPTAWRTFDETRRRLQSDRLPLAYIEMDADLRVLDWNCVAERIFGYGKEEILGENAVELLVPRPLSEQVQEIIERLEAGDMDANSINENRTKDGRIIICEWFNTPITDREGKFAGVISLAQEITERRRMEESMRYLAAIVATTDDAVVGTTLDGTVVSWNLGAKKIYGYSAEEMKGRSIALIVPPDRSHELSNILADLRRGKAIDHYETVRRRKDGVSINVSLTISPIRDKEGTITGASAIGRDITGQKLAELALRNQTQRLQILRQIERGILMAKSPETIAQGMLKRLHELIPCPRKGVVTYDLKAGQGRILASDHQADQPQVPAGTGFSLRSLGDVDAIMRDLVAGRSYVLDLASLPDSPIVQVVRSKGVRYQNILPLVSRHRLIGALHLGAYTSNELTTEQLDTARDVADMLAVALEDAQLLEQVTEHRQRLESLSRQLINSQEQERAHLARELHDEIGQQLTRLAVNLQVIRQDHSRASVPDQAKDGLETVANLLHRVRDLSLQLRPSMLDHLGLVDTLKWLLDQHPRAAGLRTHFEHPASLSGLSPELQIVCFRVVQEAVANVIRHAQASQVWIRLRAAEGRLLLTIQDNGRGFDASVERVRARQGKSVGLLGMEERVKLAGGEIGIDSALGQGTYIRVRLPLASGVAAQPEGQTR